MRYGFYLVCLLFLYVVALFITPLLPLFRQYSFGLIDNANGTGVEPRLPSWLSWFMTPDNSLFGDNNWKRSHPKGAYLDMVLWLYRNSLYGLKWGRLACTVEYNNLLEYSGNPLVNRNNGITGLFTASLYRDSEYWQWKLVKKLIGDFGVMWNFGWQLDEYVANRGTGKAMFQFSPRFVRIK